MRPGAAVPSIQSCTGRYDSGTYHLRCAATVTPYRSNTTNSQVSLCQGSEKTQFGLDTTLAAIIGMWSIPRGAQPPGVFGAFFVWKQNSGKSVKRGTNRVGSPYPISTSISWKSGTSASPFASRLGTVTNKYTPHCDRRTRPKGGRHSVYPLLLRLLWAENPGKSNGQDSLWQASHKIQSTSGASQHYVIIRYAST